MKKGKPIIIALIGLVAALVATLPFWGSKSYIRLKSHIAESHSESSVILEENGQLNSAIEKTQAAHKLAPDNLKISRRLGYLLEKKDVTKALRQFENISQHPLASNQDKIALIRLALRTGNLSIAETQLDNLQKDQPEGLDHEFHILSAKRYQARGRIEKAIRETRIILAEEESIFHKQARYLFIQLAIRSNNHNLMQEAKDTLNLMSREPGIAGLEAIRFYFDISGYTSAEAMAILQKTFQHPDATLSDKLEAATLCHNAAPERTSEITAILAKQFDLSGADPQELYLFCRWLGRIQQWGMLESNIKPEHALLSPQLYTLRLDALANLGQWERLSQETTNQNAPIASHFRMAFRVRALAKLGKEARAYEQIDRLIKETGNNRDAILKTCEYLEKTSDVLVLRYLLHRVVETDPILEPYAFRKLLIYERETASLEQICHWYDKLHSAGRNLAQFRAQKAYYDLLSGKNHGESILVAKSLYSSSPNNLEFRILMALAHFRIGELKAALNVLEMEPSPIWNKGRLGWKMIYSRILAQNGNKQKSENLLETVATAKLSIAEREGIENLRKPTESPE
ncbi:MAG: hypothetical protein HOK49_00445 [Opitutae bacterium]|nr:hypothetical protein [Opitutae bacterium]